MAKVFWLTMLLFTFRTAFLAQQTPQLSKMSPSELATFTHDLQHDLVNWQARTNQYRSRLNSSYRVDSIVLTYFGALDTGIELLRANVKDLSNKDSLANDVSLYSSLESVGSGLDQISALSADAPSMATFASSNFRDIGDIWANTIIDVEKEMGQYTRRFYAHTLASAVLMDMQLEACLPDQPKKSAK